MEEPQEGDVVCSARAFAFAEELQLGACLVPQGGGRFSHLPAPRSFQREVFCSLAPSLSQVWEGVSSISSPGWKPGMVLVWLLGASAAQRQFRLAGEFPQLHLLLALVLTV